MRGVKKNTKGRGGEQWEHQINYQFLTHYECDRKKGFKGFTWLHNRKEERVYDSHHYGKDKTAAREVSIMTSRTAREEPK